MEPEPPAFSASEEGFEAGAAPQQPPPEPKERGSGHEGVDSSPVAMVLKRKLVDGEADGPGQQRGGDQDEVVGEAHDSGFLALPDGMHRDIAAMLRREGIAQVASSCRRLWPLYYTGIRQMSLHTYYGFGPRPLKRYFSGFVNRLTAVEAIEGKPRHFNRLIKAAAAASPSMPPWMLTVRKVQVGDPYAEPGSEDSEDDDEETDEERDGEPPAADVELDRDEVVSALIDWLGRGIWPRLQRLHFVSPVTSLEVHVKDLAAALAARDGGGCDMLQVLKIEWFEDDDFVLLTDEDAMRQLLSSECCGGLQKLSLGSKIDLSPACYKLVVEYAASPRGRQLEVLLCFSSDPSTEQHDPHLIMALANGCLPMLRKLDVTYLIAGAEVSPEVSSALYDWAAGPFSKSLELLKCCAWPGLFEPLMHGLRAGHGLLLLKKLVVLFTSYATGLLDGLYRAMKGGAMPLLEDMTLQNFDGAGLTRLMDCLSSGRSPCSATLRRVLLARCSASDEEGEAVGMAMAAGACPRIGQFSIIDSPEVGDRTAKAVADAVRGGAGRWFQAFGMGRTAVGDEGVAAIKAVMQECETCLVDMFFHGSNVSGGRVRLRGRSFRTPTEVEEDLEGQGLEFDEDESDEDDSDEEDGSGEEGGDAEQEDEEQDGAQQEEDLEQQD